MKAELHNALAKLQAKRGQCNSLVIQQEQAMLCAMPDGLVTDTCHAYADEATAAAASQAEVKAELQEAYARLQAKRSQCDSLADQLAQLEAAVAETQASFEAHLAQVRLASITTAGWA